MQRGEVSFQEAVLKRRDEARDALIHYAASNHLSITGWYNAGEQQRMTAVGIDYRSYSGVVVMRCDNGRHYSTRFCFAAGRDELVSTGIENYAVRIVDGPCLKDADFVDVSYAEKLDELLLIEA
jgi:hypothetical protein